MVLGDSLSAAFGFPLEQGWVSLLQRRLGEHGLPHRVVNAAISGDTTSGGRERLPAALSLHQPEVVIVELGGNDGLRGVSLAAIGDNLAAIVATSRRSGARVLLAGVRLPPNYGKRYTEQFQQLFRDLAAEDGVGLVPQLLAGVAETPNLMQADGIHPTAAAQPRILDNLWPHLLALLAD